MKKLKLLFIVLLTCLLIFLLIIVFLKWKTCPGYCDYEYRSWATMQNTDGSFEVGPSREGCLRNCYLYWLLLPGERVNEPIPVFTTYPFVYTASSHDSEQRIRNVKWLGQFIEILDGWLNQIVRP